MFRSIALVSLYFIEVVALPGEEAFFHATRKEVAIAQLNDD